MDACEEQIRFTGKAIIDNFRVWLNSKGYVWRHTMNKMPVMNLSHNVSAILSVGRGVRHKFCVNLIFTSF